MTIRQAVTFQPKSPSKEFDDFKLQVKTLHRSYHSVDGKIDGMAMELVQLRSDIAGLAKVTTSEMQSMKAEMLSMKIEMHEMKAAMQVMKNEMLSTKMEMQSMKYQMQGMGIGMQNMATGIHDVKIAISKAVARLVEKIDNA